MSRSFQFPMNPDRAIPFPLVGGVLTAAVVATIYSPDANAQIDAEVGRILNSLSFLLWGVFVMWMCAGFCMLEAGSVRTKNVTLICLKNVGLYSICALSYFIIGYNLMYDDVSGFIGSFEIFFTPPSEQLLLDNPEAAVEHKHTATSFWLFQMVFLTTTVSIVSGTLAERVKVVPFFIFVVLHTIIIYPVVGAWAWGGGWLGELGFKDFAGSVVVHATGGSAALAASLVVGPRLKRFRRDGSVRQIPPSNVLLVTLGVFILWMGWFGFNGGSVSSMDSAMSILTMSTALVNTNLAACAAALVTLLLVRPLTGRIDVQTVLNGVLAGLVAISAAPDVVNHNFALLVGGVAGVICVLGIKLLEHFRIDDGVGAIPVHLFAGVWGVCAVSISQDHSLVVQLLGALAVCGYSFTVAFVIWNALDVMIGARAGKEAERVGLDEASLGIDSYPEFVHTPEEIWDDD